MFRNVKDDKTFSFSSANFQFIVIQFVKVISNKPFFLLKTLNPGLKLLEHIVLVSRLLVEYFDALEPLKDVCIQHIPHISIASRCLRSLPR